MEKPKAKLIGANANIYNLLAIATSTLKEAGLPRNAKQLFDKVISAKSYDKALNLILEYVDPIDCDHPEQGGFHVS